MNSPPKPISTKPAPLGRGLSALFGDADASYAPQLAAAVNRPQAPAAEPRAVAGSPMQVPVTWLQPGAFQPRRSFNDEALQGLSDSIRERGILEPLVVRPVKTAKDRYEIIAGERRWRAAQAAGLHNVPVVVRTLSDLEALEFGLIENVQRQDLSPLEEAEGYQRLLTEFNHSQEALSKIIGKSRAHIGNLLRVLALPAGVRQLLDSGALSLSHAKAIAAAKDPLALAQEIVRKGLNARQAEALAQRHNETPSAKSKTAKAQAASNAAPNADVLALEQELERVIGMKVKIETQSTGGGKAGSISLFYHDLDQLDDIIRKLRG